MTEASDRYQRVFDAFSAAREAHGPAREAVLDDTCAEDEELRREVEELLAVDHATSDGRLEEHVALGVEREAAAVFEQQAGAPKTIGPYRVLQVVAHGGQGTVYKAEQEDPRRTVALKVLRGPAVGPAALRRFEIETEALARLDHPLIAPIYEAGSLETDDGPLRYFAMQWIDGLPLDVYAKERGLGIEGRVALVAEISGAIEHAHRKGIIHRDLKPANILVDAAGAPKVLDFGVARATDSDLEAATLATTTGQVVGTLQYMSPEQVAGDPTAIDTRSDVYALGVLLHLLLAGRVPLEAPRSVAEAARRIQEDIPTRIGNEDAALKGDLETIVAKALEKEPAQRYGSAEALADDLRRHLAHEPILARPPSALYVLGRFARRRKALVGAIAGIFLALVAGAVVSAMFAREASDRADDAEARGAALRIQTARSNITAAAAALEANDPRTARRQLEGVPEDLRSWEWQVLHAQLDHSLPGPAPIDTDAEGVVIATARTLDEGTFAFVTAGRREDTGPRWHRIGVHDGTSKGRVELPAGHAPCLSRRGDRVVLVGTGGVITEVRMPFGETVRWDVLPTTQLLGFTGDERHLIGVVSDPAGRTALRRYDVRRRRVDGSWPIESLDVHFATASGSPRWAVATSSGRIWLFPADAGGSAERVDAHTGRVIDLAFTADGNHVVSVGADGAIARTSVEDRVVTSLGRVERMGPGRLSPAPGDGRMALIVGDGTMRILHTDHPEPPIVLNGHDAHAPTLRPVWAQDGKRIVTLNRHGRIRHWQVARGIVAPTLRSHVTAVLDMAVSPDLSRVASIDGSGRLAVSDIASRRRLGGLLVARANRVAWSPDGAHIAIATQTLELKRHIYVLDARDGAFVRGFPDPSPADGPLRFLSNGSTAVGRVWERAPGGDIVARVRFAAGARVAVARRERGIEIRDASTNARLLTLGRPTRRTTCLAILGDDGPLLAGSEDGTIRIWSPWPAAASALFARRTEASEPAWGAATKLPAAPTRAAPAAKEETTIDLLATGTAPRRRVALADERMRMRLETSWGRGFVLTLAGAPIQPLSIKPATGVLDVSRVEGVWKPEVVTYRSAAGSVGSDLPNAAELLDLMGALWCPLPTQAVGPGARWHVTRVRVKPSGRETTNGTLELVRWDGDRAVIRGSYERASPELLGKLRGLPKTVRARATEVRETTRLEMQIAGDLGLPAHAKVTRTAVIGVEIDTRGQKPSLGFEGRREWTVETRRRP